MHSANNNIETKKTWRNWLIKKLLINETNKEDILKFLAETVAEDIAKKCLNLDGAKTVHVSLKKPDIIAGKTEVGVEIKLSNT